MQGIFSSQQFETSDINALASTELDAASFPAAHLELEKTASCLSGNQKKIMKFLNNIDVETPEQLAFLQEKTAICTKAISKARRYPLKRLLSGFRSRALISSASQ
jgi:hypothetical protein